MRDEQHGEGELAPQAAQKRDELRLHRDVEARDDLVGDEQLRRARRARARCSPAASGRPKAGRDSARRAPPGGRPRRGAPRPAADARSKGSRGAAASSTCVTMLATRRRGLRADCGSWKTICTVSMRRRRASSLRSKASCPLELDAPPKSDFRGPMMSFASVDLPLPLSPTTPTNSFSATAKLTSSTARISVLPKRPRRER